ncbi:MAG: sensor histidine kinase, partial [Spirochaetales bacterium]|nr:sensor histidine kinase [Spirochaetales bacterium]
LYFVRDSVVAYAQLAPQFIVLLSVCSAAAVLAGLSRSVGNSVVYFLIYGPLLVLAAYPIVGSDLSRVTLFVALLLTAHTVFSRAAATVLAGVFVILALVVGSPTSLWAEPGGAGRSVFPFFYVVIAGALFFVLHRILEELKEQRRVSRQLSDSVLRLTSANLDFQEYAFEAGQRSSTDERNRITREIHDSLGYTLTNLAMMMEAAQDSVDRDHSALRRLLVAAREQAQNGLAETRRTLRIVRAVEPSAPVGVRALSQMFRTFEGATNVKVSVAYGNLPMVTTPIADRIVFRTIQEGLTNAFRHGRATEVSVAFWYDGRGINLSVQDNGVGSSGAEDGIGLVGMRERIDPLGGTVEAGNMKGGGFELKAWIPLSDDERTNDESSSGPPGR